MGFLLPQACLTQPVADEERSHPCGFLGPVLSEEELPLAENTPDPLQKPQPGPEEVRALSGGKHYDWIPFVD